MGFILPTVVGNASLLYTLHILSLASTFDAAYISLDQSSVYQVQWQDLLNKSKNAGQGGGRKVALRMNTL
jgi:hypothetical protein